MSKIMVNGHHGGNHLLQCTANDVRSQNYCSRRGSFSITTTSESIEDDEELQSEDGSSLRTTATTDQSKSRDSKGSVSRKGGARGGAQLDQKFKVNATPF